MKAVEVEMNKHKDYIDSEIKTITVLKSGFSSIRNNQKTLLQETEVRKSTFGDGKKQVTDLSQHLTSMKSELEADKENNTRELDDVTDRVETE